MTLGTLYGVGVGPGAPDLLTLRAQALLRRVPVLALPRSNDHTPSMAWRIARPAVGEVPGQERLALTFPMSTDAERVRPAVQRAVTDIGGRLERGLDVAFITEGDPSVYSTFLYVRREACARWPGLRVEVVPGVTSLTAAPAAAGLALGDGQERIAILPAAYGADDLAEVLERFDTVLLMKIGPEMPAVLAALERTGLRDRAVYVAKATMPEERIVLDVREVGAERGDCFSMVVVAKRDRSGVLVGAVPASAATRERRTDP